MEINYIFPRRIVSFKKSAGEKILTEWRTALRVLKSQKKKLALSSFYCLRQETWLDDPWKLISINQSRFHNFFHVGIFKII